METSVATSSSSSGTSTAASGSLTPATAVPAAALWPAPPAKSVAAGGGPHAVPLRHAMLLVG
eukprot:11158573-Lingulodinium_polyedra.AAC.1